VLHLRVVGGLGWVGSGRFVILEADRGIRTVQMGWNYSSGNFRKQHDAIVLYDQWRCGPKIIPPDFEMLHAKITLH